MSKAYKLTVFVIIAYLIVATIAVPSYVQAANNGAEIVGGKSYEVKGGSKYSIEEKFLVDKMSYGATSFIARMKKLDKNADIDLFVCQLSTNDATQNKPLGKLSEDSNYDTHTVAGAIEYIISYAKTNWDCPVVFYTNPYYESENYRMMVELLEEVAEKWDIEIINMWSDDSFNNITEEQRNLYMADAIHPTKAGYLEWWTPYIEEKIDDILRNNYKEVKFKVKHAEIVAIES